VTADYLQVDEQTRRVSLRPIAVLDLEPAQLARTHGLRFVEGATNLGPAVAALVQVASGNQFMLRRDDDAPTPGTEVLADERLDPSRALAEFLASLHISRRHVTWRLGFGERTVTAH
jgi:hypothetical protein